MPGDFAGVLLSTSPPMFGSNSRLGYDVVNDVTKSYFARIAAHYAVAVDAVPLPATMVGSDSHSLPSSTSSSTGSSVSSEVEATLTSRCLSDSDVQKSWHLASAVIQRCALNRSDPSLHAFTCFAADQSENQDSLFGICQQQQQQQQQKNNKTRDSAWPAYTNTVSQSQSTMPAANADKSDSQDASKQGQINRGLIRVDTLDIAITQKAVNEQKSATVTATPTPALAPAPTASPTAAAVVAEPPKRPLNKKGHCVRFADEIGKSLNAVRVIENVLSVRDAEHDSDSDSEIGKTGGRSGSDSGRYCPLMVEFAQPVSDYSRFREKLDRQNVSLENVLVNGYRVSGTVRVRNLSFEKRVYVRVSTDRWTSYTDHYATFVPNGNNSGSAQNVFDSFAFDLGDLSNKLTLYSSVNANCPTRQLSQQRIEMAVCFVSGSQSFWDSNNGRNYSVVYVPPESRLAGAADRSHKSGYTSSYRPDFTAFQDNFSEFTAWNHYDSYNPYY